MHANPPSWCPGRRSDGPLQRRSGLGGSRSLRSEGQGQGQGQREGQRQGQGSQRARSSGNSHRASSAGSNGKLELITFTNGADVYINDELKGKTPLPGPLELPPGKYTVKVKKLGHTDYIDVWVVRPGETAMVEVMLIPTAAYLVVSANVEEAKIDIDEKYVGMAPYEGELLVGKHELRVSKLCFKDHIEELDATAGSELKVDVTLTELPPELNPCIEKDEVEFTPFYRRAWFFAAAGGVVAAAAAVTVTVLMVELTYSASNPDFDSTANYTFPR